MTNRFAWIVGIALIALAPTARAEDAALQAHYSRAKDLFTAGDYRGAIREFEAAYQIGQEPKALFNTGYAYGALAMSPDGTASDAEQAIASFERYCDRYRELHHDEPTDLDTVKGYETKLRDKYHLATPPPVTQPQPPTVTQQPVTQPSRSPVTQPALPVAAVAPHRSRLQLLVGGTLTGVGVVALAIGAALAGVGYSGNGDKTGTLGHYYDGLNTLGTERGAGIGFCIAGGAAAIAGVVTLLLPPRKEAAPRVAWWLVPTTNGVAAGSSF